MKRRQRLNQEKYPPSSLILLLSPDEWEGFIEDCCRINLGVGKKYQFVAKLGGAGDAGRDVEARYQSDLVKDEWDLYQGKRYQSAIGESILYPELAKVFHHIGLGTFPAPANYYVCAPKNTTPTLHDLIAKPTALKAKFLQAWTDGKMGIDTKNFPLDKNTMDALNAFEFSNIREYPVKDLIDLHAKNPVKHEALFGIEVPREEVLVAPAVPAVMEQIYLTELLKVYAEHSSVSVNMEAAFSSEAYGEHLQGCRAEFYSAEGLKRFRRDIYPEDFEKLLEAVYAGVKRVLSSPLHQNGMVRLDAVLNHASTLQISDNPLSRRLFPADLPGACHHLVNEEKMKWVK
ncbi:hypothetical protein GCM10011396_33860 [Undibacterium terreum]|uniref:ABC-three component systems C-terminal domain-containing protein n=1 Tax=Undibacterium terreum TaxID=1224302 RepID=A0A916UQQ9_9BURK|nr:hypothetical protein GCM10011396_33860 [Undibacterium terreum]